MSIERLFDKAVDRRWLLKRSLYVLSLLNSPLSCRGIILADNLENGSSRGIFSGPKHVRLLDELVKKYNFSEEYLLGVFEEAELRSEIISRLEKPPEILPYYQYRTRFIKDEVINRGRRYLDENLELLNRIESEFGVEKEILLGILGVESRFGENSGEYRVFDALNTIFYQFPRREEFFRQEIIEFLLLCREEGIYPLSVKGSYAGAFGVPQFMPSSFRKFAVDHDNDGRKDLWRSKEDILASVANYLRSHRWIKGAPIRISIQADREDTKIKELLSRGLRETVQIGSLDTAHIKVDKFLADQYRINGQETVSIISYQDKENETEKVEIVFSNFKSIIRYNPSTNYALTVTELAKIYAGKQA